MKISYTHYVKNFFRMILLSGVAFTVEAQTVHNVTQNTLHSTIQDAVNAANPMDIIELTADIMEGQVTINKDITLDGNNFKLTSTSPAYGLFPTITGVTIRDITVEGAGTFGIHAGCGTDNLALTNVTVNLSGGTGITINGSDNCVFTNITSTNNDGNGMSFTNCDNMTINGVTTSGNMFDTGFNAGIGLFTTSDYCLPAGISGFTLTGTVSIAESTKVYSQKEAASDPITGISGATIGWAVGIGLLDRSYWVDKPTAYAVVDAVFEPPYSYPNTAVYVAEVSSENFYVDDDPNADNTPPMLIATAIAFMQPNKTLFLEAGTYNERVTVNKTMTLDGDGMTSSILDGTGLGGTGNGITINNGITGVTIRDLQVRDYAGVNGNSNAGIYAIGGNNNLSVLNCDLADNVGGSGFYANGPIDNVVINNVKAHGHTTAARGIVIWNGHKSNITITNCEVYNNNCCGIELQDGSSSAVNISDNLVYDNWDNGIGIVGMDGTTGANVVDGNIVTDNGRFGIEIKNPNGNGSNITVSDNDVSLSMPFTTLRPLEERDIAGIAVFRRGVLGSNVDVPTGIDVVNNMVDGYIQNNVNSTSEGFGIVIEGTNHTVTGNTVSSNDIGIQQQAGHLPYPGDGDQSDLADTYFGRGNAQQTCGNTINSNTFASNGTNTRDVGVGGGIVTNTNTSEIFCSIQDAIDDAQTLNTHTLTIAAGTYLENLVINKSLKLNGANMNVNCATGRGPESIIAGQGASGTTAISVTTDNVSINGFTITNPLGSFGVSFTGRSNIEILYNIITDIGNNTSGSGATHAVSITMGSGANMSDVDVSQNCFNNIRGGENTSLTGAAAKANNGSVSAVTAGFSTANFDITGLSVTNNLIDDITACDADFNDGGKGAYGVLINVGANPANAGRAVSPIITGNEITDLAGHWSHGIGLEGETPGAQVLNNLVSNLTDTKPAAADASGVMIEQNDGAGSVDIHDNSFTSMELGVRNVTATTVDAECNWYGSAAAVNVAGMNEGPVDYTPWTINGTDTAPGTRGFQPAGGACTGTPVIITSATPDPIICGETTGTVEVIFSGGSPQYDIVWSGPTPGMATNITSPYTIINLNAGVYSITVTDANGSTATASATVDYLPVTNVTDAPDTYYATIQAAIDAATNGEVISICAGTYEENIIVNKELEIYGAGTGVTTIVPSFSGPTPPSCPGSDCAGASNVIKLAASNIHLHDFTIDGNNPNLTSGVVVGGVDIDARNGIIGSSGSWTNIEINDIAMLNIWLRGIYPQFTTNMNVHDNTVTNVQGSTGSIAIFSWLSSGTVTNNTVSYANDAISANHSKGITFSGNTVTNSASGLHTDNNGSSGGVADVITGNTVSDGAANSYGIFVFAPYFNVVVSNNTVTDCNVGLTSAGSYTPGVVTTFSGNVVDAQNRPLSTGIYATTEIWGFTPGNNEVIFTNNEIRNTTDDAFYLNTDASYTLDITVNNNSITGNANGVTIIGGGTLVEDFTCNWWGSAASGVVGGAAANSTNYSPWLTEGTDAQPGTPGFQPVSGACNGTPVIISATDVTDATCSETGSILVTWSGGTAPYDIAWTGGSAMGVTSPYDITGLAAGNYGITVTDDNGSTGTANATVGLLPVTNTTQNMHYATIQSAITAANNNDVIEVCAGVYTESITINKPVTINGPNQGTPGTGVRVGEAQLLNCDIDITASSGTVTLDGFQVYQTNTLMDVILIGGGTAAVIQNNIIERWSTTTGNVVRAITTSAGAGVKTIQDNLFTGDGSNLFSGHKTWNSAMFVNGASSTVNILNNTFLNSRTALNLDDYQAGINVAGNTFNNCGTFLSFGGVVPTNGQYVFGVNDFQTPGSAFVNLSNVNPAFRLDITSSTLNGALFNTYPLTTLFQVESGMYHRGRSGRNGLVYYVSGNQYVVATLTTIQSAVDYAASGDIINVNAGSYPEEVTVDVPVTIDGGTSLCSDVVVEGGSTRLFGVRVLADIQNVTLRDFKVQNTVGTNAGIWAATNNDGLNLQNLCLENTGGLGAILAQGPVDGITINGCEVSGSGVNGRGIVIWDGLKENITITNNNVHDISGCCGIELQDGNASGVTMTGNTVSNTGDSGMAAIGLNGSTGSNTISNNTITNTGRFGMEIKNPDGNGSNITVANNNVSITVPFTTLKPTEERDIAGIAVHRRAVGPGNVDNPIGVTLTGNTVSGYIQNNVNSTSEGFGIVIEGTNHTVTGNTVSNNDIGIQQQAGHLPYPGDGDQSDLADTYFGRGNAQQTCGNTINSNTFASNGIDSRNVGEVGGVVTNTNTSETFCSIQDAIDAILTVNGHTLTVSQGTYLENIVVNKQLTIAGAGSGSDPNTNTVLSAPISCSGVGISISANNVTVSDMHVAGFFDGTVMNSVMNVLMDNVKVINACRYGMNLTGTLQNLDILNSEFSRSTVIPSTVGIRVGTGTGVDDFRFENSVLSGWIQGVYIANETSPGGPAFTNILFKNSTISNNLQKGMYFEKLSNATFDGLTMDNNGTDNAYGFNNGIDINLKWNDFANITIMNCNITNSGVTGTATDPQNPAAVTIKARDDASGYNGDPATLDNVLIKNNIITAPQNAIRIGEFGKTNATPTNVTIEGNDLSFAYGHKAVISRIGADIELECNWHGTTDLATILNDLFEGASGSILLNNILDSGSDGNPLVGFQPTGNCTCPNGNLVTRASDNATFCSFRAALDDANTVGGDVLNVGAGTYIEFVIVDKEVSILGPNSEINPCAGNRVAEAIVVPAEAAIDFGEIFHVAASNVTISGLMIDGDNTAISSGYTSTNGADIDAAEGITVYETGVNNLTVSNNIIQNLSYFGVTLYDYPAGVPSSGHLIKQNKIQHMGTYDTGSALVKWGGGVLLYNNQYAAVTDNCMENVRIGVQTGNFWQANPGAPSSQLISGNTMQVRRRGIFHNLQYNNASPFTLSANTITGLSHAGETVWDGILLSSLSVPSTSQNNTIVASGITNPSEGYEVWNVKSTSPAIITGGSISNVSTGLFLNNYDGYSSNAPDGAHATISGLSINPLASGRGIYVKDNPLSTGANVQLTVGNVVFVNGCPTGLEVDGNSAYVRLSGLLILLSP